jgi:hypothetical protein
MRVSRSRRSGEIENDGRQETGRAVTSIRSLLTGRIRELFPAALITF